MPDENISRHECVLYAFLDQDAAKKPVAARLVSNAIRAGNGFISLQVVNEFCNVMVKKSGKALSEILEATKLFGLFPMVDGSLRMTQRALEIRDLYDVQFYDALMPLPRQRVAKRSLPKT